MTRSDRETTGLTCHLRAAPRLTGLTPQLLRAWKRRDGVVEPVYLGVELPVGDLPSAVAGTGASTLPLSLARIPSPQAAPEAVERIESPEDLERRVALLGLESTGAR